MSADRIPEPEVKGPDPFPNLTFARRHLWGFWDQNAFRRMLRLGVPSPWDAYARGYRDAVRDQELAAARKNGVIPPYQTERECSNDSGN